MTETALKSTPQTALSVVQKYGDPRKLHMICPASDSKTQAESSLMVPRATSVLVDHDEDGGEVFKVGTRKIGNAWVPQLCLAKNALEKIAHAAGIVWDIRYTKPLEISPTYVLYQAVGWVRTPDGSIVRLVGSKEIDLTVIEDESRLLQTRKFLKKAPQARQELDYDDLEPEEQRLIDRAVKAEMIQFRKNKLGRAETGAKNRAVRSLGLKSTYTADELRQPFVMVRWALDPAHEYAQAERAALWQDDAPRLPANPLPAPDIEAEIDALPDEAPETAIEHEDGFDEAVVRGTEAVEKALEEEGPNGEPSETEKLYIACEELIEGLPDDQKQGMRLCLKNTTQVRDFEELRAYLQTNQVKR